MADTRALITGNDRHRLLARALFRFGDDAVQLKGHTLPWCKRARVSGKGSTRRAGERGIPDQGLMARVAERDGRIRARAATGGGDPAGAHLQDAWRGGRGWRGRNWRGGGTRGRFRRWPWRRAGGNRRRGLNRHTHWLWWLGWYGGWWHHLDGD